MTTKISELRYEMQTLQNLLETAIRLREESFKKRETLRAENEALKAENKAMLGQNGKLMIENGELETKDAQIRALVEALEELSILFVGLGKEQLNQVIEKALSAIPADGNSLNYGIRPPYPSDLGEENYSVSFEAHKEGKR